MKVAVYTLGCKTNQYEGELIRESFLSYGDEIVPFDEKADLYIINSCVVTGKAESETRRAVNYARRLNRNAKILVASCFVRLYPDFKGENVILYAGSRTKIADFLYGKAETPEGLAHEPVPDIKKEKVSFFPDRTRAMLKVEEGCNNFCSFCIVPFVRGSEIRSKPADAVLREAETLVKNGYKEIVITGTEIVKYGEDIGENLAGLIRALKKVPCLARLRLSSVHPKGLTDELIREISPPVVPHLHLSLQSGDNEILKAMNRGYTVEDYLNLVNKLQVLDPDFSVTTDIIVGFPGETEKAFLNSLRIVEKAHFSKVHIFRYSKRPGTGASLMEGTVPEKVKKERAAKLREAADRERLEFKKRFIGKTVEVLVERCNESFCEGFTPHYLRVRFKDRDIKPGDIVSIRIERAEPEILFGKREEVTLLE